MTVLLVPMEEIVRGFNYIIDQGWVWSSPASTTPEIDQVLQAFYWGTSEWTAQEIEEAYRGLSRLTPHSVSSRLDVSTRLGLIAPIAEQVQHQ